MRKKIEEIFGAFGINGDFAGFKMFKSGHINTTCLVSLDDNGVSRNYVMQKINKNVFKHPEDVMSNISNVTGFIRSKLARQGKSSDRKVLKFLPAQDGKYYTIDDNGDYWRIYEFVDKSITFDATEDKGVLEETGKAFGEFQQLLSDYPSAKLEDIIPDFHNTPKRYDTFKDTVNADPVGRAGSVQNEIYEYLCLRDLASEMQRMLDGGQLPLRVTHNDTKCNNVLFDEDTKVHLCVIDLDTVMPGLVGYDFGDAIRFAANTCDEDEKDTSKVKIDLGKFEAFTRGFLSQVGDSLTQTELRTLPLGAITMTTECGLRFLTDYIDGDNYFGISYPEHNLDRARCQLTLAQDMVRNYDLMNTIVAKCYKERHKVK